MPSSFNRDYMTHKHRRRKSKEPLPVVEDRQFVDWLSEDISSKWNKDLPMGTLLVGWCKKTQTHQLWESLGTGEKPLARFIGFVVEKL